ncbi:putative Endonuclease V [Leishmania shawi]|uniref:Endonuclease V n=1 Tax=Leishmania shawi TaxID=5680 RepID=A0AAW3B6E9_9TRYP
MDKQQQQQRPPTKHAADPGEHCAEAHALAASPSAITLQPSAEKWRAWEEEQLRIALLADVPLTEYYYGHHLSTQQKSAVQLSGEHNAGPTPDKAFLHRRFALPDFEASFAAYSLTDAGGNGEACDANSTGCLPSSPNSPWEALRYQLRFDKAQQSTAALSHSTFARQLPALTFVGGVDISFIPGTNDGVACLAILRYPSMELVKTYLHRCTLREPYVSGFLSFRELQPVCELIDAVRVELLETQTLPQVLVVDGNGVLHPRRCGLATHLGIVLDIPTIGCSKKMLQVDGLGRDAVETTLATLSEAESSSSSLPCIVPLLGTSLPTQLYGYAVHSHLNSVKKCIYVSPGHCVGFAVATALVITMLRYRIPEPIRAADLGSRAYISSTLASEAATSS